MGSAQDDYQSHLELCVQCNYDRDCMACAADGEGGHSCNCSVGAGGRGYRLAKAAEAERAQEITQKHQEILDTIALAVAGQCSCHMSGCIHEQIRQKFQLEIKSVLTGCSYLHALKFNRPIKRKGGEDHWIYLTNNGRWIDLYDGSFVKLNREDYCAVDWEIMP